MVRANFKYWTLISPSSFHYSQCERRLVIARLLDNSSKGKDYVFQQRAKTNYPLERKANYGTAIHEMERKDYATYMDDDQYRVYGNWQCSTCGEVVYGYKPASPCTNAVVVYSDGAAQNSTDCETWGEWQYDECGVICPELSTRGTIDLVLIDRRKTAIVIDYKSKDCLMYKDIERGIRYPPFGNKVQLQIYMAAFKRLHPHIKEVRGVLCYVNRGSPNQEFEIQVPYSISIEEKLLEITKEVDYHTKNKSLINKRAIGCATITDSVAMDCPFRDICFSLDSKTIKETIGE